MSNIICEKGLDYAESFVPGMKDASIITQDDLSNDRFLDILAYTISLKNNPNPEITSNETSKAIAKITAKDIKDIHEFFNNFDVMSEQGMLLMSERMDVFSESNSGILGASLGNEITKGEQNGVSELQIISEKQIQKERPFIPLAFEEYFSYKNYISEKENIGKNISFPDYFDITKNQMETKAIEEYRLHIDPKGNIDNEFITQNASKIIALSLIYQANDIPPHSLNNEAMKTLLNNSLVEDLATNIHPLSLKKDLKNCEKLVQNSLEIVNEEGETKNTYLDYSQNKYQKLNKGEKQRLKYINSQIRNSLYGIKPLATEKQNYA